MPHSKQRPVIHNYHDQVLLCTTFLFFPFDIPELLHPPSQLAVASGSRRLLYNVMSLFEQGTEGGSAYSFIFKSLNVFYYRPGRKGYEIWWNKHEVVNNKKPHLCALGVLSSWFSISSPMLKKPSCKRQTPRDANVKTPLHTQQKTQGIKRCNNQGREPLSWSRFDKLPPISPPRRQSCL